MAPPLATRSREQRNADRRPRRARLGNRSLAPQIGNDLLEIGERAVRRRTHLRTSSGPTFRADHTAIGASDHVLPVRRISPAFRMSAKDLHARPTAVSPRSGVGAKASLEAQCGDPSQTTSDCARSKRQIACADRFFIGAEGGGAGAVDDPSLDHDRQPVGNLRGELHVLLDQQDRHPALTKASHDPL